MGIAHIPNQEVSDKIKSMLEGGSNILEVCEAVQLSHGQLYKYYNKLINSTKRPDAKMGRPSSYTWDIGEQICLDLSCSPKNLWEICQQNIFYPTYPTVIRWTFVHSEFKELFEHAKRCQTQFLIDEIIFLADDSGNHEPNMLGWTKLRIETRKWLASKLLHKVYGDKKELEDLKSENEQVRDELLVLRAELAEKNKKEY